MSNNTILSLDIDAYGFEELLEAIEPKNAIRAIAKTAKEEGRRFTTQATKDVRAEYNIKSGDIKKSIKTKFHNRPPYFAYEIVIEDKKLSLNYFGTTTKNKKVNATSRKGKKFRTTRKFVSVKIKRKEKRKVVKGAFYGKNHKLFKREGKDRMPIKSLSTLSVAQMFHEDNLQPAIDKFKENYPKTMERNLLFYMGK